MPVGFALALLLAACGSDREPLAFPASPQGRLLTPTASETPAGAPATYDPSGCPAADQEPRMCEEAAAVSDALARVDLDAVLASSRPTRLSCSDVDPETFPQCDGNARRELDGYIMGASNGDTFVAPEPDYRDTLDFMRDGVDEEYSDEFGGPEYRIVGLATCEPAVRYQLSYMVGLGDPNSTIPGTRFFGTIELTEEAGGWAISKLSLGLLSDWQLTFDDPLADAGCGRIEAWGA